jgi:Flp pilus assembly protein TadG
MALNVFHRRSSPRAQTMVEFALVMPILLMVIFGVLEVGRLILTYSIVVSASREAARYGSATGLNVAGGPVHYCDTNGIKAAAQNVDFIGVIEDANITITYDNPPTCPPVPDSPVPVNRITVTVKTNFTPLAAIVPLLPITIQSTNSRTIIGKVEISP